MDMTYECNKCKAKATNEKNIYSVITTGLCIFHATGAKLKEQFTREVQVDLCGEEEYLVKKMYAKQKYGIQI